MKCFSTFKMFKVILALLIMFKNVRWVTVIFTIKTQVSNDVDATSKYIHTYKTPIWLNISSKDWNTKIKRAYSLHPCANLYNIESFHAMYIG